MFIPPFQMKYFQKTSTVIFDALNKVGVFNVLLQDLIWKIKLKLNKISTAILIHNEYNTKKCFFWNSTCHVVKKEVIMYHFFKGHCSKNFTPIKMKNSFCKIKKNFNGIKSFMLALRVRKTLYFEVGQLNY